MKGVRRQGAPWRRRAALALLASVALCAVGSVAAQTSPGLLVMSVKGPVDDSAYPELTARLSIVDGRGKPVTELSSASVEAEDDAGSIEVTELIPVADPSAPVAWVLLVDTSGSMADTRADGATFMEGAASVSRAFIGAMGPDDVARVVSFNEVTTSHTVWLPKSDPALLQSIDTIHPQQKRTFLSAGLAEASAIASNPPDGFDRRAIILLTDMDSRDRDDSLSLDAIKNSLSAPVMTFSMRQPLEADGPLTLFLTDLTNYTGGTYGLSLPGDDPTPRIALMNEAMRAAWQIRLVAPGLPDGADHSATLAVVRDGQQVASAQLTYRAGTLFRLSRIEVDGLSQGDQVSSDRDLAFELTGTEWASTRMELFRDCLPGTCAPAASTETTRLEYRLLAAPLPQGTHDFHVRATVRDSDGREFSETLTLAFERSGTTLNYGAMFLVGGLALAAIAGTGIAIRKRPRGRFDD